METKRIALFCNSRGKVGIEHTSLKGAMPTTISVNFTYDGFGRLRDGWHYLYGNPVNEWSERSITYDFGARFYDPLTARWLSPDSMADKYSSLTQYNYCGGDPVNFVDPIGMDVVIEGSEDFKKRYDSVREWLRQNDCDQLLVSIEKDHSVNIKIVESNYSSELDRRYSKRGNHLASATLHWNPNNFLLNQQDESIMISPAVILMQEVKHISEMI